MEHTQQQFQQPPHLSTSGGERQPGLEHEMEPKPIFIREGYKGSDRLKGKVALITGADSGIGRAVAVHFAREGAAAIALAYLDEHQDADETARLVEAEGAKALKLPGDIKDVQVCRSLVEKTVEQFGRIDVLVNNAAVQHVQDDIQGITPEQLEATFKTNIFSQFYITQAALKHMEDGSSVINSASVTAYKGMASLLDYSSTKGAIVSFTRSLALNLMGKGRDIRVNAVAPGPIWTPLITATFPDEKVEGFGKQAAMKRVGQPFECGPAYVFLASADASYFNGQVLHPNGGSIING